VDKVHQRLENPMYMSLQGEDMQVDVCVVTFRRPEGLERLLEGLNKLAFEKLELPPNIEIVVVDNDSAGSAYAVCERLASRLRWPLKYYIEPHRGISQARNKAIANVRTNVDFIALIDDDEVPEPLWLDELLYVQQVYAADVVGGPVLPRFHEQVPDWIIKGKFFGENPLERPRYPTGHVVKFAASGNSLIHAQLFRETSLRFDPLRGLTGGEDTHFFRQLYNAGYKMVWADAALVYEYIPESRTNLRWLLKRAYRMGLGLGRHSLENESRFAGRATRTIKGSGRIVQGSLLVLSSVALGKVTFVKGLQSISRGIGMIAGLIGIRYEIYR
jgi:succinoglycan biosynthesis protein ExoM